MFKWYGLSFYVLVGTCVGIYTNPTVAFVIVCLVALIIVLVNEA